MYKHSNILTNPQFFFTFTTQVNLMKLSIDHKSHVPLHIQAEKLMRTMIADPQYADGKLLPNEVDLAKQLAISRTTIRQALNKLVYEGLLIRKKGIGTKVATKSVSSKSNNWLSFSQEMQARGIPIKNFELHVSWALPTELIANFFEINTDKKILRSEERRVGKECRSRKRAYHDRKTEEEKADEGTR